MIDKKRVSIMDTLFFIYSMFYKKEYAKLYLSLKLYKEMLTIYFQT